MSSVDVSIDVEADGGCVVKLQATTWELNVRASAAEFMRLATIRHADWNSRESLPVGESVGACAFWSSDGQMATIVVGIDDETWDAAFIVPVHVVDEIVRLAAIHAQLPVIWSGVEQTLSVHADSELRHLDPLHAALTASGNLAADGGFVPSQGGPVCYFQRPLDPSIVEQFLASDPSLSYDSATDTVHCRHCWGAITGGGA